MALYPASISSQTPIAYWRLGDASGTTAVATVGPNGTYVNSPTLGGSSLLTNDADTAVTFALASNQRMSIPATLAAGTSAGASFSCLLRITTLTANHTLLKWSPPSNTVGYHWLFISSNGALNWQFADGTAQRVAVGPILATGTTYHVAVVHDYSGKTVKFYVNGVVTSVSVAAFGVGVPPPVNATACNLAAFLTSSNLYNGKLDEAAIFNRALTAIEVAEQYSSSQGKMDAAASISASVTVSPGAQLVQPLVVAVSATASVSAAAQVVQPLAASINATASVTAEPTAILAAAAEISVIATIAADAAAILSIAAQIIATADVLAAAEFFTPPELFPEFDDIGVTFDALPVLSVSIEEGSGLAVVVTPGTGLEVAA